MTQKSEKRKLATMKQDGWELKDAEKLHQENPTTFWLPPKAERGQLEPGDFAYLFFRMVAARRPPAEPSSRPDIDRIVKEQNRAGVAGERMWVGVESRDGDRYAGRLSNAPNNSAALEIGSPILFEAKHVLRILKPKQDAWER